jgi:carboxymethylenebutenolidase
MSGQTIKIHSSEGGEFDCYLAAPKADAAVPAIVLASAVHGVDTDIRALADEFAADGVIAAAPDLFWRTLPGPLSHDDGRSQQRSQPRLEKIETGERDLTDMLAYLRTLPQFNGNAAVIGFCYGGPYAIIGPKRLGYAGRHFLPRHAASGLCARARRRGRAGLHHLGRPRQPGAHGSA